MLRIHSTRLFPKDRGATQYRLTGIAKLCDWIVLSDKADPQTHLIKRHGTRSPRTVFLSFRWQRAALKFFVEQVLPQIDEPFTLISGSEDTTIPNQIDTRMEMFNAQDRDAVAAILNHPLLKAWIAENLDDAGHPKLHPLPLGMVFNEEPQIRELITIPSSPQLSERPLKALCGHHIRPGEQWAARRKVSEFASGPWRDWCTRLDAGVSEDEFTRLIEQHAFVLCVEGGGIDPSPKAWLTLLHGAIPIIKRSALDSAYEHLPVVFVEDWSEEALSLTRLKRWRDELVPLFDQSGLRRSVQNRLGLDYWWDYILTRT